MLNTFIKNYYYSKAKVNNILSIIYKNDLITWCCLKDTKILRHCRFRKMEMEVFVKTSVIGTVAYNFIKRNQILQPNILIYCKAYINVIQRTVLVK